MDRYEFKLRYEEIEKLMEEEKFAEAVRLADTIDWRRVKNAITLQKISELYRINKRFEECRDLLLLAYDRKPGNRSIISSLCCVSLELDDTLNAIEYFKEFTKLFPRDSEGYVLRYKIYEAQNVGIEERIELLEELKKKDRIEEWEYQLAYLYHRAGMKTQCVEECDEFILWFGEGPYVMKAMELKMLHEPLSPQQQAKYDRFCDDRIRNGVAVTSSNEDGVDFRVKTINIGAYNTMDLQAELAENLKEFIEDTDPNPSQVAVTPQSDANATEPIDKKEVFFEDKTEDIRFKIEQPQPADGVNPRLEEWKREFVDDMASRKDGVDNTTSAEQVVRTNPTPVGTVPIPPVNTRNVTEVHIPSEESIPIPQPVVNPNVREVLPEPELDRILTQGADGQISLVVPEETKLVEKQITGQLNINDILADWEKLKKANEQKHQEEVRKHVLEQTGQIFSRFDVSSKSGILAGLGDADSVEANDSFVNEVAESVIEDTARAAVGAVTAAETAIFAAAAEEASTGATAAAASAAGVVAATTSAADLASTVAEEVTEAVSAVGDATIATDNTVEELLQTVEASSEGIDEDSNAGKFYGSVTSEIPGSIWQEVAQAEAMEKEQESLDVVSLEENAEDGMISEESGEFSEESGEEASDNQEEYSSEETEDSSDAVAQDAGVSRGEQLTPEEEELFEPFLYSNKMTKQIISAIDHISLASYAGNVIISGEPGSGAMFLAKCLVRHIQAQDSNFSGNVAKITGETLNRKDVTTIISKLSNGALIIEKAGKMTQETVNNMLHMINQEGNGILILLIDRRKSIEKLLETSPDLVVFFDVKINIVPMNNDVLVSYGKRYAYDLEYSIDEMGVLALYKRISDMQTGKHAVTVLEVKKIVDEAITRNKRKTFSRFAGILSGKRYDEEDMIILKEKDFIY